MPKDIYYFSYTEKLSDGKEVRNSEEFPTLKSLLKKVFGSIQNCNISVIISPKEDSISKVNFFGKGKNIQIYCRSMFINSVDILKADILRIEKIIR